MSRVQKSRSVRCLRGLAFSVLLAGLAHCGVSHIGVVTPTSVPLPSEQSIKAAVRQVDITPPLGLGLFGHGPEARIATGVALRLRCQVFVVTGPTGQGDATDIVALVSCELPAPSLYLQREIAKKLSEQGVPIPAQRIALMATHTHFGPGHYLPAGNFSGPFSGRKIGFDPEVVEFLAAPIADSIKEAYGDLRRARVGWGYRDVSGVSRNRAMAALLQNQTLPTSIQTALDAKPEHPEDVAVHRQLSLLRVDTWDAAAQGYKPAGGLAIFGVHPSVIGNRSSLYTGDLFGYATRHAVSELDRTLGLGPGVVVGLANGIEGDVTSARTQETHAEAKRLGHRLGDTIVSLWTEMNSSSLFSETGPVRPAYQELTWPEAPVVGQHRLCEFPKVGTVSAGGASDHPTSMHIFAATWQGARTVERLNEGQCGFPKFPLITPNPKPSDGATFPAVAPIMLIQIADGLIATAPAELTTVTGLRIAETVGAASAAAAQPPTHVTVAGLTNEYLLYVATAEEYALQHYEGASTIYGPDSAEFLRGQFACLAGGLYEHPASQQMCTAGQHVPVDVTQRAPYNAHGASVMPESTAHPDDVADLSPVQEHCGPLGTCHYTLAFAGPEVGAVQKLADLDVRVYCGAQAIETSEGENIWLRYDDSHGGDSRRPWRVRWNLDQGDRAAVLAACGAGCSPHFELRQGLSVVKSPPFEMPCSLQGLSAAPAVSTKAATNGEAP